MTRRRAESPASRSTPCEPGADVGTPAIAPARPRPALERVVRTADRLFTANGIHVTGVDAIAKAAQVSKSTMYTYFRSKDDLVARSLADRGRVWQEQLKRQIDDRARSPVENILMVFDLLSGSITADPSGGRSFISSEAGTGSDSPAHAVNVAHRAWVRALFAKLARAAGSVDPDEVAVRLEMLYDGVLVGADIDPTVAWAANARAAAAQIVRESQASTCTRS